MTSRKEEGGGKARQHQRTRRRGGGRVCACGAPRDSDLDLKRYPENPLKLYLRCIPKVIVEVMRVSKGVLTVPVTMIRIFCDVKKFSMVFFVVVVADEQNVNGIKKVSSVLWFQ